MRSCKRATSHPPTAPVHRSKRISGPNISAEGEQLNLKPLSVSIERDEDGNEKNTAVTTTDDKEYLDSTVVNEVLHQSQAKSESSEKGQQEQPQSDTVSAAGRTSKESREQQVIAKESGAPHSSYDEILIGFEVKSDEEKDTCQEFVFDPPTDPEATVILLMSLANEDTFDAEHNKEPESQPLDAPAPDTTETMPGTRRNSTKVNKTTKMEGGILAGRDKNIDKTSSHLSNQGESGVECPSTPVSTVPPVKKASIKLDVDMDLEAESGRNITETEVKLSDSTTAPEAAPEKATLPVRPSNSTSTAKRRSMKKKLDAGPNPNSDPPGCNRMKKGKHFEDELERVKAINSELEGRLQESRSALTESKQHIQSLQQMYVEREDNLRHNYEKKLALFQQDKIMSLEKKEKELKLEREKLMEQIRCSKNDFAATLTAMEDKMKAMKVDLEQSTLKLRAMKAMETEKEEVARRLNSLKQREDELQIVQSERAKILRELENARAALVQSTADHEQIIEANHATIKALKETIVIASTQNLELCDELTKYKAMIEPYNNERRLLETRVTEMDETITVLTREKQILVHQKEWLETEVARLLCRRNEGV